MLTDIGFPCISQKLGLLDAAAGRASATGRVQKNGAVTSAVFE